jgi:GH24 family phage-related lysozyme (muramidase)
MDGTQIEEQMKTSQDGLQFIIDQEALVLHPYRDQAGKWTIGVGHLLTPDELDSAKVLIDGQYVAWRDDYLTEQQGMALLAQDVTRFEDAVNGYNLELTQNQFDVLVDFAFNAGEGALAQLLSHGLDDVPNQLPRWCHAGQRVIDALVTRRAAEVERWNA